MHGLPDVIGLEALIVEMHEHYGMGIDTFPTHKDEKEFRYLCLIEEIGEYQAATTTEDKLDALGDIMVFLIGTYYREDIAMPYFFNIATYFKTYKNELPKTEQTEDLVHAMRLAAFAYKTAKTKENKKLALSTIMFNLFYALHLENFVHDEFEDAFVLIMEANMKKTVGPNEKRKSFPYDLKKSKDWKAPDFTNIMVRRDARLRSEST